MTVSELIEELRKYPGDMKVLHEYDFYEYYDTHIRSEELFYNPEERCGVDYQKNPFIRVGSPCEWNKVTVVILS